MFSKNIKDFETFIYINEGIEDAGANAINKAFIKRPPIDMGGGELVERKEIVNVVREAISRLSFEWGSFFKFVSNFTIVYILDDPNCDTMAVDEHMNIYMDARFIWKNLKHDPILVGVVIMHEILHVAYNHIERGKRWLVSNHKGVSKETCHDNNLAADVEVNISMVRKGIVNKNTLKEDIAGLYLDELEGNVPPMESVLENEELMEKLRRMSPLAKNNQTDTNNNNEEIVTTSEFDEGYIEMKNKIAELVNKYGPEETINKLREIGAIEGINVKPTEDFNSDDIFALNFLIIKSFDEFINESNEGNKTGFSTKMDGYREALKKAMEEIQSSMSDSSDNGESGNGNSQNIKTNIDQSKLKPMNLPKNKNSKNNKGSGGDGGLPTNVNQDSGEENDSNDSSEQNSSNDKIVDGNKSNEQTGSGSNGGSDKQTGEYADAFSKKSTKDTKVDVSYGENKDGSIGNTGKFLEPNAAEKMRDTIKKTYGEYADDVEKQLKKNSIINTENKIEEKRKEFYNSLGKNDVIKTIWDEAKKSERKYLSMWRKILQKFLSKKTRRAGQEAEDKSDTRWGERRHMSVKVMSPYYPKIGKDVQDINVYIDVSGSVSSADVLLQLIAQSLVTFLKHYSYSGINIIPWANISTGIHKVEAIKSGSMKKATDEILKHISDGIGQCGGGTKLSSCIEEIGETTFQYKYRKKKDDVHIIISDGDTDGYECGVEDKIMSEIERRGGNSSLQKTVVENCIWMIYDNKGDSWDNNIKLGKLVKISSKNIIPN